MWLWAFQTSGVLSHAAAGMEDDTEMHQPSLQI